MNIHPSACIRDFFCLKNTVLLLQCLLNLLFCLFKVCESEFVQVRTSGMLLFPFLFPVLHIQISMSSDWRDSSHILADKLEQEIYFCHLPRKVQQPFPHSSSFESYQLCDVKEILYLQHFISCLQLISNSVLLFFFFLSQMRKCCKWIHLQHFTILRSKVLKLHSAVGREFFFWSYIESFSLPCRFSCFCSKLVNIQIPPSNEGKKMECKQP